MVAVFDRSVFQKNIWTRDVFQSEGITPNGKKIWTAEEEGILRRHYPDYATIRKLLPHRETKALHHRAYLLDLSQKQNRWLASEISKLRRIYLSSASRADLIAAFPGKSLKSIYDAAQRHRLNRPKRKYKRTGHAVMDQILARTEEIGWTLHDLDEASGTKKYFATQGWRYFRPNIVKLEKATKALGGKLAIEWIDFD